MAIVDIKMPPTHTDEGIAAAQEIRQAHPQVGVLVLSQYLESRYAMRLLEEAPDKVGYLLKDRVSDIAVLADALKRIDEGECVIDPTIVSRLLKRLREQGPFDELTARARGARPDGRGALERCDLPDTVPQPEDGRGERAADLPKARAAAVARRPPPRPRGSQVPACRATGGLTVDRRIRAIPRRRHSVQGEPAPRDGGRPSGTACAA